MFEILNITEKKSKPFKKDDGTGEIPYFWYKGEKKSDQTTLRFGSMDGTHEIGDEVEINLEKTETKGGFFYKEIIKK